HRLPQISGAPPSLLNLPAGCSFRPRCPHKFGKCSRVPGLEARLEADPNHLDRCWLDPQQKQTLRVVEGRIGLEEPS
ncbi:MAG TPA: oligopeptide/dipeptide ABC transporter ATP-binding protein, partial [Solirubrobacterales bacterium]